MGQSDKIGKQRKRVMGGKKGMGCAKPGQGTLAVEGVGFARPSKPQDSGLTIRMEVDRCLDPNPKLAKVLPKPTRRSAITRRFPLLPNVERTGMPSGDGVARQRAPVGDSLNNEQ